MSKYYVEFKTWAEGRIETPWPFVWFEEIADYRSRTNLSNKINENIIKNIFMNYNSDACGKFLSNHVCAVILGAELELESENQIMYEISRLFGYCEILGFCEITADNAAQIADVMIGAKVSSDTNHTT